MNQTGHGFKTTRKTQKTEKDDNCKRLLSILWYFLKIISNRYDFIMIAVRGSLYTLDSKDSKHTKDPKYILETPKSCLDSFKSFEAFECFESFKSCDFFESFESF